MSRWWYGLAAAFAIASILLSTWSKHNAITKAESAITRGSIPGVIMIEGTAQEPWLLFNEFNSWVDGEIVESGDQDGLLAKVTSSSGEVVLLHADQEAGSYELNGAQGVAIAAFELPQSGKYAIEGFYAKGTQAEPAVFVLIRASDTHLLVQPSWPLPFAIIAVILAILGAGYICHSRIKLLVDYESRAVPTMSSTTLPAPFWRRTCATVVDIAIIVGIMMVFSPFFVPMFDMMTADPSIWVRTTLLLLFLVLLMAYYVIPEATVGGTPGKFIMSLRTVTAEGRRLGFERSTVRNLLRAIDLFPFCYLVGAITHIMSKNNRRIGDMGADSLVVIR